MLKHKFTGIKNAQLENILKDNSSKILVQRAPDTIYIIGKKRNNPAIISIPPLSRKIIDKIKSAPKHILSILNTSFINFFLG